MPSNLAMGKMHSIKIHKILCRGDFLAAKQHTINFFSESMLLRYDVVNVDLSESYCGSNPLFWSAIKHGIGQNRQTMAEYLRELENMGCHRVADLGKLRLGYSSKILHLLAHLVDGFIGIDSAFYNFPEDSHWLSDDLRDKIIEAPDSYWLLHVEASFVSLQGAALVHK